MNIWSKLSPEQKKVQRIRSRDWRRSHPDHSRVAMAEYRKKNPWLTSWLGARQRCVNPKVKSYPWYGGKGIEFRLSREEAIALWERDKGQCLKRPSLDRINSSGHYEFSNCRFIEISENCRRSRKSA